MRWMAQVCGSVLLGSGPVAAQDDHLIAPDIVSIQDRPGFAKAFAEIVEGDPSEGARRLRAIRERFPSDPDLYILDYNLACAHARAGALPEAARSLRRAVVGGYGLFGQQLDTLARDPDLEPLRGNADWDSLMADARRRSEEFAAGEEERREPFVWIPPPVPRPEGAANEGEAPAPGILIVLHPYAVNQREFAVEHFQELCRARNLILFAPCGPEVVSPGRVAWSSSSVEFLATYPFCNRDIWMSLTRLRREHRHDPDRVYAAGLGQGGSLAFAIASRNPQWCRGAIVYGAPLAPAVLNGWLRPAVHYGRRVAVIHGDRDSQVSRQRLAAYVELCCSVGLEYRLLTHPGGFEVPADGGEWTETALEWIEEKPPVKARCPDELMLEPGEPPRLPPSENDGAQEGSRKASGDRRES